MKTVLVDFSNYDDFSGFGEIARNYCPRLAASPTDGIHYVFILPERHRGEFGSHIDYLSREHLKKELRKYNRHIDLWHATDQQFGYRRHGEGTLQLLTAMEQQPMDLNAATREELETLPFLTAQQLDELAEYLYRYGPMKSMNELRMVASLDYQRIRLLNHFCRVGIAQQPEFPKWKDVLRYGRQELTAYARVPLYERKGDQNGYLGYPLKHWVQYNFNYGDYVKAGFIGTQDSGEPFFLKGNGEFAAWAG